VLALHIEKNVYEMIGKRKRSEAMYIGGGLLGLILLVVIVVLVLRVI
jgi:hypothetical protein